MAPRAKQWVLLTIVGLAAALFSILFLLNEKRRDARMEIAAVHHELELSLATLSVRMASLATALEQAPDVTPDLFAKLYSNLEQSSLHVHERAMALMPRMSERDAITALTSRLEPEYEAARYPEFKLFPPTPSDVYFPAVLVEPKDARSNVFGYNMGTSTDRVAAAREALERGAMTATVPVSLTQDDDLTRASFLLLYPVRFARQDANSGFNSAILGAGITPAALFSDHVLLFKRHSIEMEIGISGTLLPVAFSDRENAARLRVPLLRDVALDDIRTPGFDVPVQMSVFYEPRLLDATVPLSAAILASYIAYLIMQLSKNRVSSKRALETALQRKEQELAEAYRIQARSQRIEALGRLVGGVAHDFNNILSIILGNLELLQESEGMRKDDPMVNEAINATHRGAHLTRQLLSVGRRSHLQPRTLDVSSVLRDTSSMLARVLPESIELTIAPAAGLWPIEADQNGLQNALLNLAINARDAMEGRGKLIIEASNLRATHDYLDERSEEELVPGRYVGISVTDTGIGMAPAILERAFEPFFTTKQSIDGSGLGLPSVLGFCRQSGGTCRIYSEPDVGTTVRMLLPVSDSATGISTEPEEFLATRGNKARILLAEDEDSVARVIQKQLQVAGYSVTRVSNGDTAWSRIEDGQPFDILITDLVMPGGIQGAELARRVEAARPDIRLLLISGYPQEAAIEGNGVAARHFVLTKPVPRIELLRMLDRLLKE